MQKLTVCIFMLRMDIPNSQNMHLWMVSHVISCIRDTANSNALGDLIDRQRTAYPPMPIQAKQGKEVFVILKSILLT